MSDKKIVKIFTLEQQFPCGPRSSCCGPIGQTEEQVLSLKGAIEKLDVDVEIYDIQKIKNSKEHPQVFKLLGSFGPGAIPIITVGDDVACMGHDDEEEIVAAVRSKL